MAEIDRLRAENDLLREKISEILGRLHDRKSEAVDSAQPQLLLDPDSAKKASAADPADPGPAAEPTPAKRRSPRKAWDISHLEIRETLLVSDEVKADPESFRGIDRVSTDRYDYQPAVIFISRLTRPVHVRIGDPDAVPMKAPAPPSPGLGANPGHATSTGLSDKIVTTARKKAIGCAA